jgi:hypothetical protein
MMRTFLAILLVHCAGVVAPGRHPLHGTIQERVAELIDRLAYIFKVPE